MGVSGYCSFWIRARTLPPATVSMQPQHPQPQGSLLPSTGGIGTTIFYALGGALVLGVIAVFLARKRAK